MIKWSRIKSLNTESVIYSFSAVSAANKGIWQPGEKYPAEIRYRTDINDANQIVLVSASHLKQKSIPSTGQNCKIRHSTGFTCSLDKHHSSCWQKLGFLLGNQKDFTQSSWTRCDHSYLRACHFVTEIDNLAKKLKRLQLKSKLVCPVSF